MHTHPHQLTMTNPRLFEDFRLKDAAAERVREVGVVGSAYDSILASEITYVSTPITSGRILYDAMAAAGVTHIEELRKDKDHFTQTVILPNLAAADEVAQTMVPLGGAVIAPAAFEARSLGWGQDEYMGLWLDVIERRATRLALVDGWEYSNGGAEEYLQALLMQAGRRDRNMMTILDAHGAVLSHRAALVLLAAALEHLLNRNFTPVTLAQVLHRAVLVHGMVRDEDHGQSSDQCGRTSFVLGEGYHQASGPYSELRETIYAIRAVLDAARDILPQEELYPRSSLELAPGFIRTSGRMDLQEQRVSILREDPVEDPKPN